MSCRTDIVQDHAGKGKALFKSCEAVENCGYGTRGPGAVNAEQNRAGEGTRKLGGRADARFVQAVKKTAIAFNYGQISVSGVKTGDEKIEELRRSEKERIKIRGLDAGRC